MKRNIFQIGLQVIQKSLIVLQGSHKDFQKIEYIPTNVLKGSTLDPGTSEKTTNDQGFAKV